MTTSDHPSRDRVLETLRSADEPLRLTDVCDRVGLSANAVRRHLGRLADDGLARIDHEPPRGPGRPAALYSAVPGRPEDGDAFRTLAGLLGRALSALGDQGATSAAGRDWARRVVEERERAGHARPHDALEVVVDLFADGGFGPRLVDSGGVVELHRCPFITLAVEQPEVVCAVHLGLVRGVLDEYDDPRTAHLLPVLDGSGPCVLRLGGRPRRAHRTDTDLPEEAVS